MTGNVANPEAYKFYADIGIDWMRASIGTGSRCTSSANVAIHYPSASLIDALFNERKKYAHFHNTKAPTKIILDGGVGWFDDIQKALCLGANAVMGGNIFARAEEACGPVFYAESEKEFENGNKFTLIVSTFQLTILMKFNKRKKITIQDLSKETNIENEIREIMSDAYGIQGIPTLHIFDKNGKLIDDSGRATVTNQREGAFDTWMNK